MSSIPDYQFQKQDIETSGNITEQWEEVFGDDLSYPKINYAFYGFGTSTKERLIVIEDNNDDEFTTIITMIKRVSLKNKTEENRTSCYSISAKKVMIIEMHTGDIIVNTSDSEKKRIEKLQNYIDNSEYETPYNLLAYYIPNSSLEKYFHVIFHEDVKMSKKDLLGEINNIKYDQQKRIFFGNYLIREYNDLY